MFSSYSSYTTRIEGWLRTIDLLLMVGVIVAAFLFFPVQLQKTQAIVTAVAWFFSMIMVGGQNASYLYPRYRILISMGLSLLFAAMVDFFWAGSGWNWYMKGGLLAVTMIAAAGTLAHFLIAFLTQRPAIQLLPYRITPAFQPLLNELARHGHIQIEEPLSHSSAPLPPRRPGYPIYMLVSDLRLSETDLAQVMPLYERIEIVDLCELYEAVTGKVAMVQTPEGWLLPLALRVPSPVREMVKRACEVLLVLATAPLTILVILIAAEVIKLTSPGPVFFTQERIGRYGRRFRMLKLRTMRGDAEVAGRQWSHAGDPRITPVGRVLRATGLDELPQFWHVLTGEMSLIGPRPECPEIAEHLARIVPFYHARALINPGILGWAQLHQAGDVTVDDVHNKLRYDLYYLKCGSFTLDARILLGTVQMMFHLAKPTARIAQSCQAPATKS